VRGNVNFSRRGQILKRFATHQKMKVKTLVDEPLFFFFICDTNIPLGVPLSHESYGLDIFYSMIVETKILFSEGK
jgi:hypothetical protein